MSMMHELAANWMVHALGWTLLDFCWQGALVAAVLWSGLQLLARRSATARYAAACCALVLLAVLPAVTFWHVAGVEYRLTLHGAGVALGSAQVVGAGVGDGSWTQRLAAALEPAMPWVMLAWMVGCAVFMLRLSVGFSVTRKLRLLAISPVAEELRVIFTSLRRTLGVTRPVALMHSALVQAPTVIGWLRPMVLIPVNCFAGMPLEQVKAILCHELAHIRRHDYLVSVVQSVVEALLFYHPAVWWVSRQVRRERECCCDDVAVAVGGDALAYARALTTLEARRSMYPQVMLGADGGVLTMRIKRLLIAEGSSTAGQVAALVVLVLLAVSGGMVVGTAKAAERPPVVSPAAALDLKKPEAKAEDAKAKGVARRADAVKTASVRPSKAPAAAATQPDEEPAPQQGPARVAAGVMEDQLVSKTRPVYPEIAKAAQVTGEVVLHGIIATTGEVKLARVISGPEMLRASALDAVSQWRYKPFLLNGEPTEVDTTITVNYSLEP